jgi:hypothetical protein
MKTLTLLLITCCFAISASAQGLINNNARITVLGGTYVTVNGAAGNYTNTGNGLIDLTGTIDLQGNWINNGATAVCTGANLTDGTIKFTGGNPQSIGGSAASTFENLTINKTVATTTTLNVANTSVEGNVLISTGILNANNQPMSAARNWTNLETFTSGTGTVTFDGNVAQTISPGGSSFYNIITTNNTAGSTDLNVAQPMVITGNSTFTDGVMYYSGTGSLTYNNGATSNQGSTTSFVNGVISKIGNNAFTFPTGDVTTQSVWAPIAISAPAAASTITAEYYFTSSPNNWNLSDMCNPAVLDHTSGVEYWQINRTAGAGAYSDVTLYWKDAARSGITTLPDLVVAHYEPCAGPLKWASMGGVAVNDGGGTGHITNTIPFTSYSPVTFGTKVNSNPLPVELLTFDAKCNNDIVDVSWTTATETNNAYFTLERSSDATEWTFVANIAGAGNSNSILSYQYSDEDPLNGDSYYRLKQTDFNGNESDYLPVAVSCSEQVMDEYVILYPNPANNEANILINSAVSGNTHIIVTDMIGQKVIDQQVNLNVGINIFTLNVNQLSDANYFINITTPDKVFPVQKMVINK